MHLIKSSVGSGLFAMPFAFAMSGFTTGIFLTIFTVVVVTYGMYLVVYCAHKLMYRNHVVKYTYDQCIYASLLVGPDWCKKIAKPVSYIVDFLLFFAYFGACVIYNTIVAKNIQQIVDAHQKEEDQWALNYYMAMLVPFVVALSLCRYLKYLAPFSAFANFAMVATMGVLFYYFGEEIHEPSQVKQMEDPKYWAIYFAVAIFSVEAIGVVMPLENNMKDSREFIHKPYVMFIGMTFVFIIYTFSGCLGYLRFGAACEGSVTLNFPPEDM